MQAKGVLYTNDIDYARQRYYELLRDYSLSEDQVAAIVNDTGRSRITSG
ncbi:MAG: hypothetical protein OEZ48_02555 [Candidatus Bathyarchaeota archaeon]|nr:hypothetical protein [Candidatus Bathyarchaeota archaeon]